jgi:hypothetical protein
MMVPNLELWYSLADSNASSTFCWLLPHELERAKVSGNSVFANTLRSQTWPSTGLPLIIATHQLT